MEKKEIRERIANGWIRVNMIFELIGNPKEHIEKTLKDYIVNIKTDSGVQIISEDYGEAEEVGQGLFSTFVEADMVVDGMEKVTWLCFNFTPASIEILEPTDFSIPAEYIQNWINDLLSQLHEVGSITKQISSQNKLLIANMNRMVKNSILLCLKYGVAKPKDMEKEIGIPQKQIMVFMEALMREGHIQAKGKDYERVDKKSSKKKDSGKKKKKK